MNLNEVESAKGYFDMFYDTRPTNADVYKKISEEIQYSFEEPEIIDGSIVNKSGFTKSHTQDVAVDSSMAKLTDLSLFMALVVLEIKNFSVDPRELKGLNNLKIIDLNSHSQSKDLKEFASFPALEGLNISGSSFTALVGVTELKGLKRL